MSPSVLCSLCVFGGGGAFLKQRSSNILSNQCSVAGLNANYCSSLIFCFYFLFIVFVLCHMPFFLKKTSHHSQDCPVRTYIVETCVAKKPPPLSFSLRCKLIGLCWLLWRYCLWWLPLANFYFWAVALIHHAPTAWRVTVATMNCVWCVVSFLLLFLPWFWNPCKHWSITVTLPQHL